MAKFLLIVSLFVVAGCSWVPCRKSPIVEVGSSLEVRDCQLLKSFYGPGGYRMWGTPYMGNFKNEVFEQAEKMGATHALTRTEIQESEIGATTVVNVYKCPPEHEQLKNEEDDTEE